MVQPVSGWRRAFRRFQRPRWFLLSILLVFAIQRGVIMAAVVGSIGFVALWAVFLWIEASDDQAWAAQSVPES